MDAPTTFAPPLSFPRKRESTLSFYFQTAVDAIKLLFHSVEPFAGVARQLVTFFASSKKVTKERRCDTIAPYGGTQKVRRQNGKHRKLACGSNNLCFFIRFDTCLFGDA
jgi:hypothetical protein